MMKSIHFGAGDTFTVYTAGSERVRINSDGKFGIGTNNDGDVLSKDKLELTYFY